MGARALVVMVGAREGTPRHVVAMVPAVPLSRCAVVFSAAFEVWGSEAVGVGDGCVFGGGGGGGGVVTHHGVGGCGGVGEGREI
ncbi:hypothetical protein CCP2SC5_70061 [Azospirillaceae bacterium]